MSALRTILLCLLVALALSACKDKGERREAPAVGLDALRRAAVLARRMRVDGERAEALERADDLEVREALAVAEGLIRLQIQQQEQVEGLREARHLLAAAESRHGPMVAPAAREKQVGVMQRLRTETQP